MRLRSYGRAAELMRFQCILCTVYHTNPKPQHHQHIYTQSVILQSYVFNLQAHQIRTNSNIRIVQGEGIFCICIMHTGILCLQ